MTSQFHCVGTSSGAHLASYITGIGASLSMVIKQPGHEADHSSPSSAEVKNAWNYTSIPPYILMAWCVVK
jgi:hypothetical protein